jgi:hypothetical protein
MYCPGSSGPLGQLSAGQQAPTSTHQPNFSVEVPWRTCAALMTRWCRNNGRLDNSYPALQGIVQERVGLSVIPSLYSSPENQIPVSVLAPLSTTLNLSTRNSLGCHALLLVSGKRISPKDKLPGTLHLETSQLSGTIFFASVITTA